MGRKLRIFVAAIATVALLGSVASAKLGGGESRSTASVAIIQTA